MSKSKCWDIFIDKSLDLFIVFVGVFAGLWAAERAENNKAYEEYQKNMASLYSQVAGLEDDPNFQKSLQDFSSVRDLIEMDYKELSFGEQIDRHKKILEALRKAYLFEDTINLDYAYLKDSRLLYRDFDLSEDENRVKGYINAFFEISYPALKKTQKEHIKRVSEMFNHFVEKRLIGKDKDGAYEVLVPPKRFHELEVGYYKLSNSITMSDVYQAATRGLLQKIKEHGEKAYPDKEKAKNELILEMDTEKKKANAKPKE